MCLYFDDFASLMQQHPRTKTTMLYQHFSYSQFVARMYSLKVIVVIPGKILSTVNPSPMSICTLNSNQHPC